jgi:hypothetical protein
MKPEPTWFDNIPMCTKDCHQNDGKRCLMLGFRPTDICEIVVSDMAKELDINKMLDMFKYGTYYN